MMIMLPGEPATALRQGQKTEHRLLLEDPAVAPVQPGDVVTFSAIGMYGKREDIASVSIESVRRQLLEDISDAEIVLEGYANWTRFSYAWNQYNPTARWDAGTEVWILTWRT